MMHFFKIIFLILVLNTNILFALGYSANPTKLILSQNQKIETLTIQNISNEKTSIQIDPVHWDQKNNEEMYSFTKDIIVSPKIVTLFPGKSQIIRIGLKRALRNDVEGNYRIILRELTLPDNPYKLNHIKGNVRMSLNMNIPLFIEPLKKEMTVPRWIIKKINDQKIKLICNNPRNIHLVISDIRLLDKNHRPISNPLKSFRYILPRKEIHWDINLHENEINNIYKIDSKINNENIALNAYLAK
jgi:fimbrial chaperone protein